MTIKVILDYIGYALYLGIPIFIIWSILRSHYIKKYQINRRLRDESTLWLFVFFLICLYMITVFRAEFSIEKMIVRPSDAVKINRIPLVELRKLWGYGYIWSFTYNIVGNIIWFLPFGFLLPYIKKNWGIVTVTCMGMLVSCSIEVLQYICVTGITDIDDIIFNTVGTLMGVILFKISYKTIKATKT